MSPDNSADFLFLSRPFVFSFSLCLTTSCASPNCSRQETQHLEIHPPYRFLFSVPRVEKKEKLHVQSRFLLTILWKQKWGFITAAQTICNSILNIPTLQNPFSGSPNVMEKRWLHLVLALLILMLPSLPLSLMSALTLLLNSLSILMFYLSVIQSHSAEISADDRIVYLASSVYVRRQLWFHRRTFFSIVHFQNFVKIIFYSSVMQMLHPVDVLKFN